MFSTFFWYFIIIFDIWRASRLVVIITRSSILHFNIRRKFRVIEGSPKRLIVYCFFGFMIPIFMAVPFNLPNVISAIFPSRSTISKVFTAVLQVCGNFLHFVIAMNILSRPAHFQGNDEENFYKLKDRWVWKSFVEA
jgi:hypothetical protein